MINTGYPTENEDPFQRKQRQTQLKMKNRSKNLNIQLKTKTNHFKRWNNQLKTKKIPFACHF